MRHAIILHGGSGLEGGAFDASSITGSFIEPAAPPPGASGLPRVKGTIIQGGIQTLDGIEWDHATFIGTRIVYKGGQIKLVNGTTFINCTFEAQLSPQAVDLTTYVALSESHLSTDGAPS